MYSQKRYEEYAYVLDFIPRGKSRIIRSREGPIIQAIGENRLTFLEILALKGLEFEIGERLNIGKEGRTKVISVLGKLSFEELTNEANNELESVVELIVNNDEKKYVDIFNSLQPITPRLHSLELIPGIGKTFMNQILNERNKKPFESFYDITIRIGLRDPSKLIAKRILEELSGSSRVSLFTKR